MRRSPRLDSVRRLLQSPHARVGLAVCALLLLATLPLSAQDSNPDAAPGSDEQPPLFVDRVDVNVVNVEVFVTDGQGRRVTGLTKDDFEVRQDGQPVELTNFFAVAQPNRVDLELERTNPAAADAAVLTPPSELPEEQQLNLLVYVDHFNIRPQNRQRALEQLEGFLEDRMFQGDRVMLMGYDGQLEVAQPFTRDWNEVRRALRDLGKVKTMGPQADVERRLALQQIRLANEENEPSLALDAIRSYVQRQQVDLRRSTAALDQTARAMAGLPGRKAVLYVSDGLPQRPGEDLYKFMEEQFSDTVQGPGGLADPTTFTRASMPAIADDEGKLFNRIIREANANQVTFYTVDARGGAGSAGVGADLDSMEVSGSGRFVLEALRTLNYQEPLISMAEATGGSSILNTYELSDAFYRTGVDFDSFYSLGFQAPSTGDGEYHRLQVTVKRPGLKVRHRNGFVDKAPEMRVADRTLSSLIFGMESNPLGVEVDFGEPQRKGRGAYELPVLVRIPFRDVTLLPSGGMQRGQLRIYLVVKDDKGGVSDMHQFPYPLEVPQAQMAETRKKEIGFARMLRLAPGTPQVAVGVWDELSGTESFIHKEVRVETERQQRKRERNRGGR